MLNTSIPLEILNLSSKKAELKNACCLQHNRLYLAPSGARQPQFVAFAACYTKCLIHGGRKIRHQTYIHVASFVYCDCYLSLHAGKRGWATLFPSSVFIFEPNREMTYLLSRVIYRDIDNLTASQSGVYTLALQNRA